MDANMERENAQAEAAAAEVNPLLSFTAMDFETGSRKYHNSVCQVGLVKVVGGVYMEFSSTTIT
jgi:hypothetical protein